MNLFVPVEILSQSFKQLTRTAQGFSLLALLIAVAGLLSGSSSFSFTSALGIMAAATCLQLKCITINARFLKYFSFSLSLSITLLGLINYADFVLNQHFLVAKMSTADSANFVLIGFSLIFLDFKPTELVRLSQVLAIMSAFLPVHSLIFYSYGVEMTMGSASYLALTQMTLWSATAWLCLAFSTLLTRPDRGLLQPFVFDQRISSSWRSIFLTGIIIPVTFGFIFSLGYRKGLFGPVFGFSLLAVASVFIMAFFIWRSANHNWQVRRDQTDVENKIKRALQLRNDFLSIASHELKTPLTSLSLQAQISKLNILRDDPNALSKEQLLKFLTKMDFQVVRLAQLVEDMLDITRIDSGRFTPTLKPTDVGQLVYDLVDELGPQIVAAGCTVTLCVPQSITAVWDTYRIEQVLFNLITNAIKYGAKKTIVITATQRNDRAVLTVQDFGIGIAKENQQRIFNRFERAVSAKGITGLGLGLYIVKQILDSHQGEITLDSEPGKGSTFRISLPLTPAFVEFSKRSENANFGIGS